MYFVRNILKTGNTVNLYQQGCDTFNQANEKRGDSSEVKEGDIARKECRKTYTIEYSMIIDKRVNKSDKVR